MKRYQKIASHGLIRKGNKYLIVHRSKQNDYMPGKWDLPGGTVEFGEDPIFALEREIGEEVSLKVRNPQLSSIFSFISKPARHQLQIIYKCDYLGGQVELNPEEHDDFKWVTAKEMESFDKIAFLNDFYDRYLKK